MIAGLVAGTPALAAPTPSVIDGVVELFTSQGCSSCPPADRLLAQLAARPDTVALTFAINYWDYIGWKDTLAAPEFTARQQAYANGRPDPHVYTPEAVIDGLFDAVGSDKAAIEKALAHGKASGQALSVSAHLRESGGKLEIDIGGGTAAPAEVYVLRVARTRTVQISSGENSGRRVTYTNVVRAIRKVSDWDGAPLSLKLTELRGDDEGYVVLLQRGSLDQPGAILAAAKSEGL
ncbi:MAG: DUF1223 domain-containing protein [Methylovirgula sp.]|nr:DUF1223 domain-containing protein [Methylovirgula sp.]